jgi:hypothetical protein
MYLAQFDKWDRYDHDGDGNFNEPDGYIDHFQIVHAGEGEETGGGAQGADAIWSHRSYTNVAGAGVGPGGNPLGGVRIGGSELLDRRLHRRAGERRRGRVRHEFGHDLGLPDEYDTSGNTGGAENSTGFWTNWSQGSYGSDGTPQDGIGNRPIAMDRVGAVLPRLAELPHGQPGPVQPDQGRARPDGVQQHLAAGRGREPAGQEGDDERRVRRSRARSSITRARGTTSTSSWSSRSRCRPGRRSRRRSGTTRSRTGTTATWWSRPTVAHLDVRPHEPLDEHKPERAELRRGDHRRLGRGYVDRT